MKEKDFIKELGFLTFVTRLKRISDAMIHDGRRLYKEMGMDIEPNWFVVFKLLERHQELTVTEIADRIGFSHPSVISLVNKMIKAEYLMESKTIADSRKRILSLTPKAIEKMPEFEKVWEAGVAGIKKMLVELDALRFLDVVEAKVFAKGFKRRTLEELSHQKEVQILEFENQYGNDFARLNYEWIEESFAVEKHDREMLDNPIKNIMRPGGEIFLARIEGEIVGTVALIYVDENTFELAKMAVTKKYRGWKIGDKLMEACTEYSRKLRKNKIFLLSNTKLIPAINMYKKFGFVEVPMGRNNGYKRTNIKMELVLE